MTKRLDRGWIIMSIPTLAIASSPSSDIESGARAVAVDVGTARSIMSESFQACSAARVWTELAVRCVSARRHLDVS